jgi:hypothetical protein
MSALEVALATIAEQRIEREARRREVQELHVLAAGSAGAEEY